MADSTSEFDSWLNVKLNALNIDEGIYGSYIKGILEGDDSVEDKTEAIEGILSEITKDDLSSHCKEIIENWQLVIQNQINESNKNTEDVDVKLARLMESQAKMTTVTKTYTEDEKKIREAILAQYSQMSDEEESVETEKTGGSQKTSTLQESGIEKNTNASVVAQAEREKRDKAKLESQKKKEKDKEDREKQKQQQAERKEKRKTQKGERRR